MSSAVLKIGIWFADNLNACGDVLSSRISEVQRSRLEWVWPHLPRKTA